jgi:hypothetical protein
MVGSNVLMLLSNRPSFSVRRRGLPRFLQLPWYLGPNSVGYQPAAVATDMQEKVFAAGLKNVPLSKVIRVSEIRALE